MNTLTNEQVGLQIAKQTINKLNKKNMMVGYFQNQNLNWIKEHSAKQIISTKQSKYHQKHLRLPPSQVHTKKKLNIYNEMLQHYNNT
jgi:septum formation inhibitor MinC